MKEPIVRQGTTVGAGKGRHPETSLMFLSTDETLNGAGIHAEPTAKREKSGSVG